MTTHTTPGPSPAGRCVLIIDDDQLYANAIALQLQAAGFRSRVALDAVAAVAEIDAARPDLILLDVNMPGVDGVDLCRYIKTVRADLRIPTIILTAMSSDELRSRLLRLGADGFVTKPVAAATLLARVREAIPGLAAV
jgi:DNA-binding response OmpR family regulator